jgi:hypothetical protein
VPKTAVVPGAGNVARGVWSVQVSGPQRGKAFTALAESWRAGQVAKRPPNPPAHQSPPAGRAAGAQPPAWDPRWEQPPTTPRTFTYETVTVGGRELVKETSDDGVVRWFVRGADGELELLEAHAPYEGTDTSALLRGAMIMDVDPVPYLKANPADPDPVRWWLTMVGEYGKHPSQMSPQELNRFWVEYFRTYRKMYA